MKLAAFLLLPFLCVLGQTVPTFEVASIKPSQDTSGSSAINSTNGRISGHNVTLRRCIRGAYGVPEAQVLGGPRWVDEERYEIEAKAAGPVGDRDLMQMLQALLAERFQLQLHKETRTLPGYALVVGKGGVTAKPSAPGTPSRGNSSRESIDAAGYSMGLLAMKLSEVLHLPVSDATQVAGNFDFHLKFGPEDRQAKSDAPLGPSVFAAVQEQLGLKLEPRKVPTEVLVIDRAEKPSAN